MQTCFSRAKDETGKDAGSRSSTATSATEDEARRSLAAVKSGDELVDGALVASGFDKASVRDADVAGRRVLVRVDFNAPLEEGRVADASRIEAALPTIALLRERGAALVVVSHLGRPKDREPELSMGPVAERLAEMIEADVQLAPGVVGEQVEAMAAALEPGAVLLLENSRFEEGEKANDPELAAALAGLADVYVDDAFGAAHRAHAT